MHAYTAPIQDMAFVLNNLVGLEQIGAYEHFQQHDLNDDLVAALLEESGKFTGDIIAPLNRLGEEQPPYLENGVVRVHEAFHEAYQQFVDSGWMSVAFDPEYGGQGLPWAVQVAVAEMLNSSCMSFALGPLLTQGAIDALEFHGSKEQKDHYLPNLIQGRWSGTMNLTEPHAGTDVGAAKSRAVKQDDGSYKIKGQKIFITWGEHEMAENIIHLVLARTPGAPEGTKGISLFIVPKYLLKEDGTPGVRNDLRCAGLEEKLGIHGSPTCVMSYGDNDGAIGYLVGEENRGMEYMFTMMNNARLAVGVQGIAIAERAYQQALAYSKERVQSADLGSRDKTPVAIIKHPDVRRTLLTMKATIEAMRGLAYYTLAAQDKARHASDPQEQMHYQMLVDLLTPVVKAWCTDQGVELASMGVQLHGGMGFIEETGAAQHYRDARILPIYEGTNGVQALDLMGRKLIRNQGQAAVTLLAMMRETATQLENISAYQDMAVSLAQGLDALEQTVRWTVETGMDDIKAAAGGATPLLEMFGLVAGGWIMAQRALVAHQQLSTSQANGAQGFLTAQQQTARYYCDALLPKVQSLKATVMAGGLVAHYSEAQF